LANATTYLEAFGHTVMAWIWLSQLLAAEKNMNDIERNFYLGKRQAARYFFLHELPKVNAMFDLCEAADMTALDTKAEWL
jgi:Acetyl-CoA dehydrogenase C-terminal like